MPLGYALAPVDPAGDAGTLGVPNGEVQSPGKLQGDAQAPAESARDAGTPGGRHIQASCQPLVDAPATVGDFEPAETADIPQLDGAEPGLDTLCDPHSGHVFNAVNCKHESNKCQYRRRVIDNPMNYGHIKEILMSNLKIRKYVLISLPNNNVSFQMITDYIPLSGYSMNHYVWQKSILVNNIVYFFQNCLPFPSLCSKSYLVR